MLCRMSICINFAKDINHNVMNNQFYLKPKTQTLSNCEVRSFFNHLLKLKPEKPSESIIKTILQNVAFKKQNICNNGI